MRDVKNREKALIVIDVQEGFVSNETEHVLPNIKEYLDKFDGELIIATQFINKGGGFKDILHWKRLKESPETNVLGMVVDAADYVVEKNQYSACNNEIMELLNANKIKEVCLIGIDTDCCVLKTAIDLFEKNIRPVVIAHCCSSNGGEESHNAALRVLERTIGTAQIE